jgi:hypothetical protein
MVIFKKNMGQTDSINFNGGMGAGTLLPQRDKE